MCAREFLRENVNRSIFYANKTSEKVVEIINSQ